MALGRCTRLDRTSPPGATDVWGSATGAGRGRTPSPAGSLRARRTDPATPEYRARQSVLSAGCHTTRLLVTHPAQVASYGLSGSDLRLPTPRRGAGQPRRTYRPCTA